MTHIAKHLIALLFAMLAALPVQAQPAPRSYSQAELDQMLAPIALYPDPLLSQLLMAATYPLEVVQAARWSRANPGLRGDAAVRAAQDQDWDPSVQSLVAFPQILQRMDENLRWTESLGDAFLAQEPLVMDTVQQLRRRAQASGNLQSDAQIRVEQQGPVIVVQPAAPEVVYLPYYDPYVVYGPWWWPAYRPVAWAPWPGYGHAPGVSAGFWFGSPSGVSLSFFFGNFDWGHHTVRVVRPHAYYYRPPVVVVNRTTVVNRNVTVDRGAWQHDPHHRRGVAYRAPEVRQRFASQPGERRDVRSEQPARAQTQSRPQPQPQPRQEQRAEPRPQAQPRQVQLQSQQPKEVSQPSVARQMQLRSEQPKAVPQPSAARQMQLRNEQARARPQAQPQVRQEQRAESRPQPKPHQEQRAEPRQEQKQERQAQRQERGNGRGGERS